MSRGNSKVKKQGRIVSLSDWADIMGRTLPTVRNQIRDGLPAKRPSKSAQGYEIDTAEAIQWLVDRARNAGEGQALDFDADRARKMAADADVAEMERDTMRGELVEVDVAVSMVADRLQTIRARLLNLPTKAAVKLAACRTREEVVERLDLEIQELLQELSGGAGSSDD